MKYPWIRAIYNIHMCATVFWASDFLSRVACINSAATFNFKAFISMSKSTKLDSGNVVIYKLSKLSRM